MDKAGPFQGAFRTPPKAGTISSAALPCWNVEVSAARVGLQALSAGFTTVC